MSFKMEGAAGIRLPFCGGYSTSQGSVDFPADNPVTGPVVTHGEGAWRRLGALRASSQAPQLGSPTGSVERARRAAAGC